MGGRLRGHLEYGGRMASFRRGIKHGRLESGCSGSKLGRARASTDRVARGLICDGATRQTVEPANHGDRYQVERIVTES